MSSSERSSGFYSKLFLLVVFLAGSVFILSKQQKWKAPIVETHEHIKEPNVQHSLFSFDVDWLNKDPVIPDKDEFVISDVVQANVIRGSRVRVSTVRRRYIRGTVVRSDGNYYFSSWAIPRRHGVKSARVLFRRFRGRCHQFRAFSIVGHAGRTVVTIYPCRGRPILIDLHRRSRISRFKNNVFSRLVGSVLAGAFVKLDVKLGAAGFIRDKNTAVQAITFFANSFAIRATKIRRAWRHWGVVDEEYETANHMVTTFLKLGRMPTSMDEVLGALADDQGMSLNPRRMLSLRCFRNPIKCLTGRKVPTCRLRRACGNPCLGRCGRDCSCWKWVCGSCDCRCNCWNHDVYCSCRSNLHPMCIDVAAFTSCYQRCYMRAPRPAPRPPPRPPARRCYANGALKLAQDENGGDIPMEDKPATKEEVESMQVVAPDAKSDKLMSVPDGWTWGWRRIAGHLTNVAVSSRGSIYGVNRYQQIWAKRAWNRGRWTKLPGHLRQISVNTGGTIVTGVNRHQQIWYTRVNVNNIGAVRWVNAPGKLVDVSSGATFRYGVTSHDHIYRASLTGHNWCRLPGALTQISAHGRKVVGVSRRGAVYQYFGYGRWRHIRSPRARWASMGSDGDLWVIATNQAIFRLVRGRFKQIPGALVQIDVADKNNIVGVNRHQAIWAFVRTRQSRNLCSRPRHCRFPFRYRGVVYRSCTSDGYGNNFWCSHDSVYRGRRSRCGNCKASIRASCSSCRCYQKIRVTYSFPLNAGINWRSGWIGLVPRGIKSRWERPNDARDVSWFRIGRARGSGVLRTHRRGHYDIKAFTSDHPHGVQVGQNVRVFVA